MIEEYHLKIENDHKLKMKFKAVVLNWFLKKKENKKSKTPVKAHKTPWNLSFTITITIY